MQGLVPPGFGGKRLLAYLRDGLGLSGSAIRRAKWGGTILVGGEPSHVDRILRAGETVEVRFPEEVPAYVVKPYPLAVDIRWEDGALMVIDKPAPLASQSGRNHPDDSLENALFSHLGCPEGFIYRPVNRLDRGTSGLMAVALNAVEHARLQRLLHTEAFRREYLAVTEGLPPEPEGRIDAPIAKENGPTVRRIISPEGRPCVTHYRVLRTAGNRALLSLRLETGRTHQIRVHLASLGCPVAGDFLYGTELTELPGRFALHSALISFPARGGETVTVRSPLPEALERLLGGSSGLGAEALADRGAKP